MANTEAGAWPAGDWVKFRRFLMSGNEKSSSSAEEKDIAKEGPQSLKNLLQKGLGVKAVDEIKGICDKMQGSRQKAVLYALAVCAKDPDFADLKTKQAAFAALKSVCRLPTDLFHFIHCCHLIVRQRAGNSKKPLGWGRCARTAISDWYNSKDPMVLAMHLTKYKQRHHWSHRDMLRMTHVKPKDKATALVLRYAARGYKAMLEEASERSEAEERDEAEERVARYLEGVNAFKQTRDVEEASRLVREHRLLREHVPTWLYNTPQVWEALLDDMPVGALLRSLGHMAGLGLLGPLSASAGLIVSRLHDTELLHNARIQPLELLLVAQSYNTGKGVKGKQKWKVNPAISDALMQAFYSSFTNVASSGRRYLVALDVSYSMHDGATVGCPQISPLRAAAALVMLLQRTETTPPTVVGFSKTGVQSISVNENMEIEDVEHAISQVEMGDVDPAAPMTWAQQRSAAFDVFLVLTDCVTYPGIETPASTLRRYRDAMEIPQARFVSVGLASEGFSLSEPEDAGMLDVAGFSADLPNLLRTFVSLNEPAEH